MTTIATLEGEEVLTKVCIKCKEEKPLTEFCARTRDEKGVITERRNDCNDCKKEYARELKDLKKTVPTIDQDTYACPLCHRTKEDMDYQSYKNPFVLDHDHETKEARGWVCQDCNTALARMHDSPDTARRMVEYLEAEDRGVYLGNATKSFTELM